jgi:hypothetical protein
MRASEFQLIASSHSDRPVIASLSSANGVRFLSATCCFGGGTIAELWDSSLARIDVEDFTLRGIERVSEAGVVQEWRLRPHHVDVWTPKDRSD